MAAIARLAGLAILAGVFCGPARADDAAPPPPNLHTLDLFERDVATGDWGGLRSALEDAGVVLGADSIDETLANLSGGTRTGTIYEGQLELLATIDLDKTLGWTGATFHANAYQIHGRGLSANDLGNNLLVASNIEATPATRLFDAWVEQLLFGTAVSVRAGEIAADDEFFTSQGAASFVNATFGWPAILSAALPSGGPAYPLATPGFRVRYAPSVPLSLAVGVFDGDPAGAGPGDPQRRDPSGTAFRTQDGTFVIGEVSYAVNQDQGGEGLPATYKLGAWLHTGLFADQRFATTLHSGDDGVYAVVDQFLWRREGTPDQGLSGFVRVAGAPSDRNEVAFYADTGLTFKGPVATRGDDLAGIAFALAEIGSRAAALDAERRAVTGVDTPIRDHEAALELFYRVQATPWWTLQPDLQLVLHPGGNVAPPGSTMAIPNATVVGVRSSVIF